MEPFKISIGIVYYLQQIAILNELAFICIFLKIIS